MASLKTCDFCKRSEPLIAFGSADNALPTDSRVEFHDSVGTPRSVVVAVACSIPAKLDVCVDCREKIITAGVADIAKRRSQGALGVFVAGENTQRRVDNPTANKL